VESERCDGGKAAICVRVRAARTIDDRALPAVRYRALDRLCPAAGQPARRSGRPGVAEIAIAAGGAAAPAGKPAKSRPSRTQPCREAARQPDAGGHRAGGLGAPAGGFGAPAGVHELRPAEGQVGARARRAGANFAGVRHHRGAAVAGRAGGAAAAQEARAYRALLRTVGARRCSQPRVALRFQRLVPHCGRPAHRSADHLGCAYAAPVPPSGRGEGRHGPRAGRFEAAFGEYGPPQAIRTDQGAPFGSRALAGLSRLAAGWISLGIVPQPIAAGHPKQNGTHEPCIAR
jgi:hypothetical protein